MNIVPNTNEDVVTLFPVEDKAKTLNLKEANPEVQAAFKALTRANQDLAAAQHNLRQMKRHTTRCHDAVKQARFDLKTLILSGEQAA